MNGLMDRWIQPLIRGLISRLLLHRSFKESRLAFVQRNPDSECRAAPHVAFEINPPAVSADDSLDDHQSEAGPFLLRRIERFEDAVDLFLRNSASGVRR